MPRIRSLKPEFCSSPAIAALSIPCRLHFAMLWTHADDEGRGIDNPLLIKAALWPLDTDVTAAEVESWQAELADHGRIIRYESEGKLYFQIVNFLEHQHPSRPRPSVFPPPPSPSMSPHGGVSEGSVNGHGGLQAVDKCPISHSGNGLVKADTEPSLSPHGVLPAVVGAGAGEREREQEQERAQPREIFGAAVELLLLRFDKAGIAATKANPASWLASARRGLKADYHDRANDLIAQNPAMTAEELADLLVPPVPPPPRPPGHVPYISDAERADS